MQLFIKKEKFAEIMGYPNYDDYKKKAGRLSVKHLTKSRIDDAYSTIKKHSRYLVLK